MKKKRLMKCMAAVLAVTMLLSVTGCGGREEGASLAQGTEHTSAGEAQSESAQAAGEQQEAGGEFSYYGPLWKPYKESTPVFDELMLRTGITVNFEWANEDGFSTQLASKVAAQELPDVISGGTAPPDAIDDLIKQGLIVPLTDYLEKDMPNYMRFIDDEDKLQLINQEDGEIYGFGLVMDVPPAYSTMVRKDWLDRLNLEMPQTWDDWVNVWKAFAKEDANGNGDPRDEIPFAVNYDWFKFILNMFGMQSNGTFSVADGEYLYDPENPRYETFLDNMRQLYADGLFAKEFVTLKGADFNTLGASNTLGSLVGYAEYAKNYTISCREIDENALFSCVVPIKGPDGAQNIPARAKVTSSTYVTVQAVEDGHLESILKFFNYVYSDEGIELTNYGIEGEYFDREEGKPVLKEPYNESFSVARENGLIPSTIPFCFTQDLYMQILMGGMDYESLEDSGKTFIDGMTINEPYYYVEPPLLKTEAYVDNFDLLEQQTALRDKYIMGQISKDEYNKQYEALKKAGLADVIEQGKEAYRKIKE